MNNPSIAPIFAAIDIGSNAARLLIKRLELPEVPGTDAPAQLRKVFFLRYPLRLGDDVFTPAGRISPQRQRKMLYMIKAFKQLMRLHDVNHLAACATSAMREARDGDKLLECIRRKTGIRIRLISGAEEAGIIYGNHVGYAAGLSRPCAYVDVGGGSTEISVLAAGGEVVSSQSYKIGTLRMLHEGADYSQRILADISQGLERARQELGGAPIDIVGSGGNINKLYRLVHAKSTSQILTTAELEQMLGRLEPLTPQERMQAFGLKPDRADVIVPAGLIFRTAARALGARHIHVPMLGLADGMIDRMAERYIKRWEKKNGKSECELPLEEEGDHEAIEA